LSFHLAVLGPTGAHWLDAPTDLSCKETTRRHSADGWPLLALLLFLGDSILAFTAEQLRQRRAYRLRLERERTIKPASPTTATR
jgi:hypothetical protein